MSNREYTLEFCTQCTKRKFDSKKGIICSLSNDIAKFTRNCPDYIEDIEMLQKRAEQKEAFEKQEKLRELENYTLGLHKYGFNSGITVGVLCIAGAVVWFFVGLEADIIFFYPPILFCIGLYKLFVGISKKRKSRKIEIKDIIDQ